MVQETMLLSPENRGASWEGGGADGQAAGLDVRGNGRGRVQCF